MFARCRGDDELAHLLIGWAYPLGIYVLCVVPSKGVRDLVVERLTMLLNETCLVQFAYRSNTEPSIVAMAEAACKLSGRQGTDEALGDIKKAFDAKPLNATHDPKTDFTFALPGADGSHPGETQSNGNAKAAVKNLINQCQRYRMCGLVWGRLTPT